MFHLIPLWSEICGSVAVMILQCHLPLEITFTALRNQVMEEAHCFHNLSFSVTRTDNSIA